MHGGSLLSLSLCLSIVGCGIIIICFLGVAGGEHRDAAGFEAGAEETEKYEARCVGQEPRLLDYYFAGVFRFLPTDQSANCVALRSTDL